MNNQFLLGGAAVLVVGAAFAGGYYVSHPSAPAVAQAPATVAETPAPTAPIEQTAAPVASAPAQTTTVVEAKPAVKKRRVPDYASGETAYAPPPPPPPPPPRETGPNPFEARFATFPMRHSGSGTLESPLTWSAQTDLGRGHEADLRVSLVVPVPPPGDNGTFWSKWGSRGGDDVMPDITRGTPVVVAGSASVVLAIDPQFLNLDAPAILTVSGRDGQRIYRSRDVAPARGESWNAEGARWIFQPDADFFRMMRDGADVSVSFRSRASANPIRVPFATDDFPPSLNGFERDLSARLPGIAMAWGRARPGAPPPPPPQRQANNPPANYPPPQNGPYGGPPNGRPRGPMPPQYGPPQPQGYAASQAAQNFGPQNVPPSAPAAAAPSAQAGNGHAHGDHAHDHTPPAQASAPPAPVPTGAPPTHPVPPTRTATVTPPAAPPASAPPAHAATPRAAPTANAPPAHPSAPPMRTAAAPPKPPTPPAPVAKTTFINAGSVEIVAEVAAYRPPTDNCGAAPPMPQGSGPSPERKQAKIWFRCRVQWMNEYKQGINGLNRDAARGHIALEAVSGGSAVVAAFEKAQSDFNAQKAIINP